jgi:hypothetical protein
LRDKDQPGSCLEMQTVRPIAISTASAIMTFLIAAASLPCAFAAESSEAIPGRFMIAQTSMGGPDPLLPTVPGAPVPPPRTDSIAPGPAPGPSFGPSQDPTTELAWGAIGFTADGSYSSTWKMASKPEAEAKVAKKCAEFGHGGCQVVSFSGQICVALATFIGSYKRRRWNLSFTAGGETYPEAQDAAMARCNSDERAQGRCQFRAAACADGR